MNPMTDDELDREWKPNGRRPQSTIARSFSQELMDIFRIENSVADLDEQVAKRKQTVTTHQTELEALEARIREMEKRLGKQPGDAQQQPTRPAQDPKGASAGGRGSAPAAAEKDQKHSSGRPGSARQQNQQAVPGAAPPTPVASEGEYELVHAPSTTTDPQQRLLPQQPHPASMNSSFTSLHRSILQQETQSHSPTSIRSLHLRPGGAGGADDARSVKSERSFADYVVVPAQDGDGEQDA